MDFYTQPNFPVSRRKQNEKAGKWVPDSYSGIEDKKEGGNEILLQSC